MCVEAGAGGDADRTNLILMDSVIFERCMMVSRMCNRTKGVETWVNDFLRVPLAFLVKLERERKDAIPQCAKNKNPPVGDPVLFFDFVSETMGLLAF